MKNHRTIHIWPVYVAVFAALVSGCAGGNAGKERPFPYVTVPGVITDGAEAAEFLGEHFWDDFMDTTEVFLCDSSHVNGVTDRDFEQAFADYAGILGMLPLEDAEQAVEDLYIRSEAFERHDSSTNWLYGCTEGRLPAYGGHVLSQHDRMSGHRLRVFRQVGQGVFAVRNQGGLYPVVFLQSGMRGMHAHNQYPR